MRADDPKNPPTLRQAETLAVSYFLPPEPSSGPPHLMVWTHSGLDGFQQQDGLFVSAGGLSELPLLDQRVALHVEQRHRLQLLVFLHHPRLAVVGHGVAHLEAAEAGGQTIAILFILILVLCYIASA